MPSASKGNPNRFVPASVLVLMIATIGRVDALVEPSYGYGCDDPFQNEPALRFDTTGWKTDFCRFSVPYSEIRSGGPQRDGIPPIDSPRFVSVVEAGQWIGDREPVVQLQLDGVVRGYPLQILTWHEIVNDVLGKTPVAVTFCPLCYAAIVFIRPEIDGEVLTFGTSGNLRFSDLVMWDRQTESWWQQFDGKAIVGSLTGTRLKPVPASIVSWKEFRQRHPEADILSRETGFLRRYGDNPYVGYDDVTIQPWLYDGPVDGTMRPMERIIGVEVATSGKAYVLDKVKEEKVLHDVIDEKPVVILWAAGTASALDTRQIAGGRDIGAVGVFLSEVDGRILTFQPHGRSRFLDRETKSTWNIFGESVDGPLAGRRMQPLVHHNTFWFVWSAFRPESTPRP